MLKGLLFDMDGTLVDNLAYHFKAFEEYAKQKGFELLEPLSLSTMVCTAMRYSML